MENSCFIIMPFGGRFDACYKDVLLPAIEAAGLKPKRADDLFMSTGIMDDIWYSIESAQIVIAELSGQNANVFYELGLAHALGKPAVLISESIDFVPFDLRHIKTILYDMSHPKWGDVLEKEITKHLQASVKDTNKATPLTFHKPTHKKIVESSDESDKSKKSELKKKAAEDLNKLYAHERRPESEVIEIVTSKYPELEMRTIVKLLNSIKQVFEY